MNNELIGGLHRRDFMKLGAMGVGGVSASGWMNVLAIQMALANSNPLQPMLVVFKSANTSPNFPNGCTNLLSFAG
ncbi:hypothetical protein EBS67_11610 [bacterium]|nr:hypothetical protein [bacterium]